VELALKRQPRQISTLKRNESGHRLMKMALLPISGYPNGLLLKFKATASVIWIGRRLQPTCVDNHVITKLTAFAEKTQRWWF